MITSNSELTYEAGSLHFQGLDLRVVAELHGTPTIVYSAQSVRSAATLLQRTFGRDGIRVSYSAKACYLRRILRSAHEHGLGIEVCSVNEYRLARRAGVPWQDIQWNAVALSDAEAEFIADARVGLLGLNTLADVRRVGRSCSVTGHKQPVLLRVHPAGVAGGYLDRGSRLGFDGADGSALRAVEEALANPGLELVGLHAHTQTHQVHADAFLNALDGLLGCAVDAARRLGWRAVKVGLGGGLAEPSAFDGPQGGLELLSRAMRSRLDEHPWRVELLLEPGRFMVSDAAIGLTRVLARQHAPGAEWWIVDLGTNYLVPFEKRRFPLLPMTRSLAPSTRISVGDRLSSYSGILATDLELSGDGSELLAAPHVGAYTGSVQQRFMYGEPLILWLDGDRLEVLKEREDPERWVDVVGGN